VSVGNALTRSTIVTPSQRLVRAFNKPNSRFKFRELVDITKLTAIKTNGLIDELRAQGMKIIYGKVDHCFYLSKIPTPYSNSFDLSHLPKKGRFGAISDTHLCSDAERLDLLRYAYAEMKSQGVTTVLHAGDICDGWEVYMGHAQFVKVGGGAKQARYAIQHYPKVEGITTYFISGN